jgi:hypothetical protein
VKPGPKILPQILGGVQRWVAKNSDQGGYPLTQLVIKVFGRLTIPANQPITEDPLFGSLGKMRELWLSLHSYMTKFDDGAG